MTCKTCKGTCEIYREVPKRRRVVTDDGSFVWIIEGTIRGIDACPECAARAETEYMRECGLFMKVAAE